jgi:hypothetical protein
LPNKEKKNATSISIVQILMTLSEHLKTVLFLHASEIQLVKVKG